MELNIVLQEKPEGIPQAISLCERHLIGQPFYLALGDNILLGSGLLNRFMELVQGAYEQAVILGYPVSDVSKYGVAEFDNDKKLLRVIEKPRSSESNLAVVGLYKFGPKAFELTKKLTKSERGEYEIADLINFYIMEDRCDLVRCNVATDFWLDTGTFGALVSASNFVRELTNSGLRQVGNLGNQHEILL